MLVSGSEVVAELFLKGKQMMFKILTDAVDEKLALIAPVVRKIEQGGQSADLRDLASHVVRALRLFQRNPGIEAAADDLYAAACALVRENTTFLQPTTRGRRLLNEAYLRFRNRLEAAADRVGPYEYLVVPDFPVWRAA
jgi:hypothetical protein